MAIGFSETKIKAPDLYRVCTGLLLTYGDSVQEAISETSKIVAKDIAKDLRKAGRFKGGERFRKGWDVQRRRLSGLGEVWVVHNKTKPGLAHLLEFGHAIYGGGRTKPFSEAFHFIQPIADTAEQRFRETFVDVMAEKI